MGNIKHACLKHFAHFIGKNMSCDILAGEQGPSCQTRDQIPDLKLIFVRFIPGRRSVNLDSMVRDDSNCSVSVTGNSSVNQINSDTGSAFKRPNPISTVTATGAIKKSDHRDSHENQHNSVVVPRSLSLADMIRLGKLNKLCLSTSTVINILEFDMDQFAWCKVQTQGEFFEEKEPIGCGGFRKAYKATTKHPEFKGSTWVIKRYIAEAVKGIQETDQTTEGHTRKVVQMHMLARNFASQLETKVQRENQTESFGEMLKYKKVYYGETDSKECVTVEEFVDGQFTKYMNNTGLLCVDQDSEVAQKAACLSHFSFEKAKKKLLLVDIQGSGYNCFDPEIASSTLYDDQDVSEILYCTGNLSTLAISNCVDAHECNKYCAIAGLDKNLS